MGQAIGKARFLPSSKLFLNLSPESVAELWKGFNDIAEGFGISCVECQEICRGLHNELEITPSSMDESSEALFGIFDTDKNGLVDGIEFLTAIAAISGMRIEDIFQFIFSCFDFDGSHDLTIDETILGLKCTINGLCKLSSESSIREEDIEVLCSRAFVALNRSPEDDSCKISEIVNYCLNNPDVQSWVFHFNDSEESLHPFITPTDKEIDYDQETALPKRAQQISMELTLSNVVCSSNQASSEHKQEFEQEKIPLWRSQVTDLVPSSFSQNRQTAQQIEESQTHAGGRLVLEWVYGYDGQRTRRNVRYSSTGKIVYHLARVGMCYDFDKHSQAVNTDHSDDIACFAMHANKEIVATGERGKKPRIVIWNANTCETVRIITGFHRHGIQQLAFASQAGAGSDLLVSIGGDRYHTLALYNWITGIMVFSSRITESRVLDCCITPSLTICVAGKTFLTFWRSEAEGYVRRNAIFGQQSRFQIQTCVACLSKYVISGSVMGSLFVWSERNCVKQVNAHKGSVNCLYAVDNTLVSGGKDMKVRIWTIRMESLSSFDVSGFGHCASVRSICLSDDLSRVLVGTKGSDIFEISAVDGSDLRGGSLVSGHCSGQCRALASHPLKDEIATVGDDKTLRIWDYHTKSLRRIMKFDTEVGCVCYNTSGNLLFIGFGSATSQSLNPKIGSYLVLNEVDLSQVHEAKDSSKYITIMKTSPDGEVLAIGSSDCIIYLYAINDDFDLIGRCQRHTLPVQKLDFSVDSQWIMTNAYNSFEIDKAGEICFFNSDDSSNVSDCSTMRDIVWSSHSCHMSFPCQAIHEESIDAVAEVNNSIVSPSKRILIYSNTLGNVMMRPFPCILGKGTVMSCSAHSDRISEFSFCRDNATLMSLGETDRCCFQWKLIEDDRPIDNPPEAEAETETESCRLEMRDQAQACGDSVKKCKGFESMGSIFKESTCIETAAYLSPWMDRVVAPSGKIQSDPSIPNISIVLERAYGFRGDDGRGTIQYNSCDELIFATGCIVTIHNISSDSQRFYCCHDDKVSTVAISNDGCIVASGQLGISAKILVWRCDTSMQTIREIEDQFQNSVCNILFSPNDSLLVASGSDEDHTIKIFDWRSGQVLNRFCGGKLKIMDLSFSVSGKCLLQTGDKHVQLWIIPCHSSSKMIGFEKGRLGEFGTLQIMTSCIFMGDIPVVGTNDGHLYVFNSFGELALSDELSCPSSRFMTEIPHLQLSRSAKAHDGPITCLRTMEIDNSIAKSMSTLVSNFRTKVIGRRNLSGENNYQTLSCGEDGIVRIWNASLECQREIHVKDIHYACVSPLARGLALSFAKDKLAVSTKGQEVYEIDVKTSRNLHKSSIISGHGRRDTWSLALHPSQPVLVSGGDDHTLRMWDTSTFCLKSCIKLESSIRALEFSPDGRYLAVGMGDGRKARNTTEGKVAVYLYPEMKSIFEARDTSEWIRVVCYSPDGTCLAVGCQDSRVFLYNAGDSYTRRGCFMGASKYVTSIEFSLDSRYMRVTDGDHNLSFADAGSATHIPSASSLRDIVWSSWTSIAGYQTHGVWLNHPRKPADPSSCSVANLAVSASKCYVATGDDWGRLCVFNFPCTKPSAYVCHNAHGGTVRNVKWSADNSHIFTVGGSDNIILQWRVSFPSEVDNSQQCAEAWCKDPQISMDGGNDIAQSSSSTWDPTSARPWVTEMVSASIAATDDSCPNYRLSVEYVHGIRVRDCRNCIKYNLNAHLVYQAAGLGVIFNKSDNTQSFYTGHKTSPIQCLDVAFGGLRVATGDSSRTPEVHVWDAMSGHLVKKFCHHHLKSIVLVRFNSDGKLLASVGRDVANSLTVFSSSSGQWEDGVILCSVFTGHCKPLCIEFSLTRHETRSAFPIFLGTDDQTMFLSPNGRTMLRQYGIVGSNYKKQPILSCCAALDSVTQSSVFLSGSATGYIFVWKDLRIMRAISAHMGPILSICPIRATPIVVASAESKHNDGSIEEKHSSTLKQSRNMYEFATTSKDGLVKVYSETFHPLVQFNVSELFPNPYIPVVNSMSCYNSGSKMVLALAGGEIFELSLDSLKASCLMQGHSISELHGLVCNPVLPDIYATCGDDHYVRMFSISQRQCIRRSKLDSALRCMDWNPSGSLLAVGVGGDPSSTVKDGAFFILDGTTFDIIHEDRKSKLWIRDIKFSPNADMLAIASTDGKLYIHDTTRNFPIKMTLSVSKSPLLFADFSLENAFVRICTEAQEFVHFALPDGSKLATLHVVRDAKWHKENTIYGWNHQAIWRLGDETPSNIRCAAVDPVASRSMVVSGDSSGHLSVFRFPSQFRVAPYREMPGCATSIARVSFTRDGERLIALDSQTRSIIQYKIENARISL